MPSKPVAYLLLVAACMVAAGIGAFIAVYQPRAAVPAATVPGSAHQSQAAPQPVGAVQSSTPSIETDSSPAKPAQATPAEGARSHSDEPRRAAERKPASPTRPQAENPPPDAQPASQVPMGQGGVDPGPQFPRTSPGASSGQPPVQEPPVQVAGGVDPGRADGAPVRQEPMKAWIEVDVPAESVIGLRLETAIDSETARVEDPVGARVVRDVRVGSRVVIPAGTEAIGSVTLVEKGGKVKERARLGIRFNTLVFADQSRVTISTETIYREGESPGQKSAAKIGGAAIGGAIVGAILGGGKGAAIGSGIGAAGGTAAAMAGNRMPVVVPAGTTISVRTQEPFTVVIDK